MNIILANVQDKNTPQFNKNITEGSAKKVLKGAPNYLDAIIVSNMKTTSQFGLEYHGWRRLTPKEEFDKLAKQKDVKVIYDLARSDLYMVEFRFTYNGAPIYRYIYLPYAERGNIMKISDTNYHILPVLSDTVISPSNDELFVRLLKDKLTFNRITKNFIVDGEKALGQIIHSAIYRLAGRQIQDNLGTSFPSTSLYLAAVFGVKDTLKKYANITNMRITKDGNTSDYIGNYRVYESTGLKPRGLKEHNYFPHDLKILIPREQITQDNISFIDNFIYGLLYTLDLMPNLGDELLEMFDTHDVANEKLAWKLTLGRVIFKNGYSVDKMSIEMNDHFNSLSNYMDSQIREKLRDIGIHVNSFFDLLAVILSNYNTWLLNSKEHNSDINNRYLDMLYYLLYDIFAGLNRALGDISKKGSKRVLAEKEVVTIFGENVKPRKIFNIIKSSSVNLAIMHVD